MKIQRHNTEPHGKGLSALRMGGDVTVTARAHAVLPACPRDRNFTLEIHSFSTEVCPVAAIKKKVVGNSERVSRGRVGKWRTEGAGKGPQGTSAPLAAGGRGV